MQLGVYSFGDRAVDPTTGRSASTAQSMRNLLEAVTLADQVGLDYFGIGEHHTEAMPASAAATLLAGAATATTRIRLGSAVTVLSTDDPVRVYQQFATLDAITEGRAEITAGRGSSTESYPLFGYSLSDYEVLALEKLDLLLAIDAAPRVTWSGTVRPALDEAVVVPRPDRGHLPIWVGTGGSPASTVRAGRRGLPVAYGIIGGRPERFGALAELYRQAYLQSGHGGEPIISVGSLGFVGESTPAARDTWWPRYRDAFTKAGKQRGWAAPDERHFAAEVEVGALFVGGPERVAERILTLHEAMGHRRHFLQMDFGGLPQGDYLRAIELLGTRVKPLIDAELGAEPAILPAWPGRVDSTIAASVDSTTDAPTEVEA